MVPVSETPRPLRILTLDGGGLQANSTLLILDELLNTIAKVNREKRKPRPCDIFDVITGIGTGGWLALLLGRFHMDVAACLSDWYNITQSIAKRSSAGGVRKQLLDQYYFDPERLVEHINDLTKIYGTGEVL
jgi:patatin-like phospholipase/acyl hydrolase